MNNSNKAVLVHILSYASRNKPERRNIRQQVCPAELIDSTGKRYKVVELFWVVLRRGPKRGTEDVIESVLKEVTDVLGNSPIYFVHCDQSLGITLPQANLGKEIQWTRVHTEGYIEVSPNLRGAL